MSRIGKLPIELPDSVDVEFMETSVRVKGPKGTLTVAKQEKLDYELQDNIITITPKDNSKRARQMHGLGRTLLNNAVNGVVQGFSKSLELVGVGYKVNVQGEKVILDVGYSHPIEYNLPAGIQASVEGARLTLNGIDKQMVGEVAAQIRRIRPPEPYKGKGIKYIDEQIRRKAGKTAKK